jgi:two-component system response regulator YesN
MDQRVQIVIDLMKDDMRRGLSLTEIAQSVNLSSSRLRYLFKAETGVPIAQYFKSLRMQKAKELLENTFLSVKEITVSVGINDESHFVRDFKKNFGLTPSQYRERYRASLSTPQESNQRVIR